MRFQKTPQILIQEDAIQYSRIFLRPTNPCPDLNETYLPIIQYGVPSINLSVIKVFVELLIVVNITLC